MRKLRKSKRWQILSSNTTAGVSRVIPGPRSSVVHLKLFPAVFRTKRSDWWLAGWLQVLDCGPTPLRHIAGNLRTFVLTAQNGGGLSNSSCTLRLQPDIELSPTVSIEVYRDRECVDISVIQCFRLVIIYTQGLHSAVQSRNIQK